jgi:signal transduction histidine kinase
MTSRPVLEEVSRRSFLWYNLVGYLIFLIITVRKLSPLNGKPGFPLACALLAAFLILYSITIHPTLFKRLGRAVPLFYLFEAGVVQALGLVRPYEDTWGALYVIIALQIVLTLSPRATLAWGMAFAASIILTLMATFGAINGLGRGLFIVAAGAFLVSYDLIYLRSEAARRESQKLLTELQMAHKKLGDYAAQAEALSAEQERNRLTHELHDSVGQMIFSIRLTTESTRMLLEKDPGRVAGELERLQELTSQALSQMRALISQWRP